MCDKPATHYVTKPKRSLLCKEHAREAKQGQIVNHIGDAGYSGACEWDLSPHPTEAPQEADE